jgi:hyperosmotically inducible periplasmic protein
LLLSTVRARISACKQGTQMNRFLISLIAVALMAACTPTRTTKSAGEQVDDTLITSRVKTALTKELGRDALKMDIETFRGRVQLNGFIDSPDSRTAATRIARSVDGVQDVENNLRLATESRSAGENVDDKILASRIKVALAEDKEVKARDVNIEVREGVVQLGGFVDTSEQKSRASELARGVDGVKKVDNQLEVKQR